ncbi:hypothetical protein [Streptomyces zhihengii]
MDIALLRILLAPSLVLVVSLVARRAGPALGGRLLGAPTTTGPFLLLMCWDSGGTAAAEHHPSTPPYGRVGHIRG